MVAEADPLQQILELAAMALGTADVQMSVVGEPLVATVTARPVSSSTNWIDQRGFANVDAQTNDVNAWVRSIAVSPLTGPSGESGFLIAGADELDRFDESSLVVIDHVIELIEGQLDRSAEQIRMDRLGEVLRSNQEQLRQAKDRLSLSNEELEQFAYIAAHELVAPLRAVALWAEVLEPLVMNEEIDFSQIARCIDSIRNGVAGMDQQVRQLLELSNVQGQVSHLSPLSLADVVDKALFTMSVPLEEAGAVVEVGTLPDVLGREVPLQSVFANLVSNSLRYRHPTRELRISITSKQTNGLANVHVVDNGTGVDSDARDRIFQMFERGATEVPGTGIGLALSRRIVEAIGGEIALSRTDEHGSEFIVSLQLRDG